MASGRMTPGVLGALKETKGLGGLTKGWPVLGVGFVIGN